MAKRSRFPKGTDPKTAAELAHQTRKQQALKLYQYLRTLPGAMKTKQGKLVREVTRRQETAAVVFECGCAMPQPTLPGWPLIRPCVKHQKAIGAWQQQGLGLVEDVEVATRGRRAVMFTEE